MLFSMVAAPHPTRAEVADVANAVLDGSDAVMLSDETTVGKYPVKAVETMAAIVAETERGSTTDRAAATTNRDERDAGVTEDEALAHGACELATRIGADFIATLTESGRTARLVAKYRPSQAILAATYRPEAYRRLALVHGITPVEVPATSRNRDEMIATAHKVLSDSGWRGKRAVFVTKDSVFVGNV
jgi:pyruvate kinase